ncbi:signal peptidase II [Galactobacter caseinivorans]|uniref:Lipoprotein signal peptidase n=1 Tax=Galactobacter caseinivorans TaxID=2676123 RepID=A0A496PN70_9MICC|nr:signal peptidase II [Galactobacter caseinivorans]
MTIAAVVLLIGYSADQFTKYLVVTHMQLGEVIWVLPPFLKWYSIRNPGAAFSMGEGYTWIFTVFMAIVAVGVLVMLPRVRSRLWGLALGGLLTGTLGNLTDRLFQPPGAGSGHVVDFVSVGNFAIFNIADSFIVCSVIGIVALLWFGVQMDGSRGEKAKEETAKDSAHDAEATPEPGKDAA